MSAAVLLLAHGSPDTAADIPEYLKRIMGSREPSPEVVAEVTHRFALTGRSPLRDITMKQGADLARTLGVPVYVGMRNWTPFIAEVVQEMAAAGVERAVAICLAPQNSRTSTGKYREALGEPPFAVEFVESWHDHPLLIRAFAERLQAGLAQAQPEAGGELPVIFTAHSVPERTIAEGDPYAQQAKETATLVARAAGLGDGAWLFAYQSQGMSGGTWLGPTVEETMLGLKEMGHAGVFVQPIGFLCDHVEVLYDIDIGFREFAARQGMGLWRAESRNDSPLLIEALAEIARRHL
jgi:ferrochelatase